MNCPVCDRSLAPTLSICPTCGAMMNDTVREELQTKISPTPQTSMPAARPATPQAPSMLGGVSPAMEVKREPVIQPRVEPQRPAMIARPIVKRPETGGLNVSKTSPTLVEFQNKNASLPDWRLQLQNAVQQRKGLQTATAGTTAPAAQFPTNGGAALKAEIVARPARETVPAPEISDPRVANAMRRIEESRNTFREPDVLASRAAATKPVAPRFGVVASNGPASTAPAQAGPRIQPKPKLVPSVPVAERRDTNRLPRLDTPQVEIPQAEPQVIAKVVPLADDPVVLPPEFAEIKRIRIKAETVESDEIETAESAADEIEDLAPLSMRFGACLFDFIIAGFVAMVLLSPVALTSGNWFSPMGLLTFAAALAVVSFLYMTVCLGFFGKTMGMRLFSLELVDAVENEYPTLQQAAINSSVFILLLGVAGAGFLTVFFNEERRALHDLLSGTILVKEF